MRPKRSTVIAVVGLGMVAAAAIMARPGDWRRTDLREPEPGGSSRPSTADDRPPDAPAERPSTGAAASGKAAVIKQLEEGFRDTYLALISIIQGFTLAFLAERIFTDPPPTAEQWLAYTVCLMMMVTVWMEYLVGSTSFTWIPSLLDSIIPFGLGMAEVPLIIGARMDAGAFLTRLAIFLAVGLVAYANWLCHADRGGELNRHSYPILGRYVRFGAIACSALLATTVALVALRDADIGFGDIAALVATLILVQPLFLHSIFDWTIALRRIRSRDPAADRESVSAPARHSGLRRIPGRKLVVSVLVSALRLADPDHRLAAEGRAEGE